MNAFFGKLRDAAPKYDINDLRREVGEAMKRARAAKIHPIEIERAVNACADASAQHRAMFDPVRR